MIAEAGDTMSEIDPDKLAAAVAYYDDDCRPAAPQFYELLAAARAHLATLPRWKEVEVWRVEWASAANLPNIEQFLSEREALRSAKERRELGRECISVTGPHKQRVPA